MEDIRQLLASAQSPTVAGCKRPPGLQDGEGGHHHRHTQKSRRSRRGDSRHGRIPPLAEKRAGVNFTEELLFKFSFGATTRLFFPAGNLQY